MTKRSAMVLLLLISATRGFGAEGGGGGSQVGFLTFSMAATVLTVPPLSEPKTRVMQGFGATLLTIPDMTVDLQLKAGVMAHGAAAGVMSAVEPSPSPSSTPTPPSIIPAGGGSTVLQGLTDKVADVEKTPTKTPGVTATRGMASARLLSSVSLSKTSNLTRSPSGAVEAPVARGIAPPDADYIKVFRSIPATYGWDPGTVDISDPVQPTAAATGHKQR